MNAQVGPRSIHKEMVGGSDSIGLSVNTGCADREPIPHGAARVP